MDYMQGLVYTGLCIFYKGVGQAKVSNANEFLDAIQIMIDKASEKQTKIYNGTVIAIGENNTCSVTVNGKTHQRISYYGKTPTVNQVYRVFVPQNNMSIAFIITEGADITPSEATDYNDLLNRPQINNVTLSGNKTAKDLGLYGTSNPPSYPVTSVNSKTGNVVLTQDDVGDGTTYVRTHNDFTDALKQQINTNEDNIAMLDTDVGGLQTDVTNLQTNVTNISNALTGKQDSIVGAASTITEDNLTPNRAVISNSSGKIAVSDITATELGYLDGAKSNIQKQIDDISAGASTSHVVTITKNGDNYTADTTFAQIESWLDNTESVSVKYFIQTGIAEYFTLSERANGAYVTFENAAGTEAGTTKYVIKTVQIEYDETVSVEANPYISTNEQTLSTTQQEQARKNIGLGNVDNIKQYSADNPPPYPVTSVNSKTGAVTLGASDVGAVSTDDVTQTLGSSTTKVPSEKAVSDAIGATGGGDMLKATYDPTGTVATAGGIPNYVTNNSPVKSVDGKTGAVVTEAVKYTSQTLTSAQQEQARTNIGAFNKDADYLNENRVQWDRDKNANAEQKLSPIISSLDPALAGNKFAFCKPGGITIEYTNDSGSTWSAYSATDSQKIALMTQNLGLEFFIGGKRNAKATVDDQLRITIDAIDCGVYTYLTNIILDISTNGATGCQCKVEYSVNTAVDTFIEYYTYPISGWSGKNSFPWLPANISSFGDSRTTTAGMKKLRLTFFCTGVNNNYNSNLSVTNIYLIGIQNWKTNSNLAKSGHLYSYNTNGNVIFPGNIRATTSLITGNGQNVYVKDSKGNNAINLSGSTGTIVATGNINASKGTITANKFVGDGSGLTNLPSSGSSAHIVTVTANGSGTYTADATFVQIEAWINNGEQVVLRHSYNGDGYSYLPLALYYPNAIVIFEGTTLLPTGGSGTAIIEQITIEYDEAVNRYEFSVLKENKDYTFTVPTTGWSNNSITVAVSGVQSSYNTKPIIDLNITPGATNVDAFNEAYSKIYAVTTGDNKVTVYATEVPTTAISLTMKVIN